MAHGQNQSVFSMIADGAIAAFRFVKQTSSDRSVEEAGANERVYGGGPDYAVDDEEHIPVVRAGHVEIELGGTVAAGARVKSDASGKAVAAATSGTTLQEVAGVAIKGGVSGDIVPIDIHPEAYRPAIS